MKIWKIQWIIVFSMAAAGFLSACLPIEQAGLDSQSTALTKTALAPLAEPDDLPAQLQEKNYTAPRPHYQPGELVDYIAQTGDTLPKLAVRFNTTVEEIHKANPFIPRDATTMPPGMPMKIPIYYLPFWGTRYKIIPDSLFVNGPEQRSFDTQAFLDQHPTWIKSYLGYAEGGNRSGAELIDLVARNYLVSPRLLIALLEYQSAAISTGHPNEDAHVYPMGFREKKYKDLYMQMVWAANLLNDGYYSWRDGILTQYEHRNGRIERPDPWQNAGTIALQYFFLHLQPQEEYDHSISPQGIAQTYQQLFGDPWMEQQAHIPGSLQQPYMILPFEPGKIWALTGGPHTGWGTGQPWAALDFAPPSTAFGCVSSNEWATAVAPGVVTRSETGMVSLDLDGDGDERTGWVVSYLHIATKDRVPLGTKLNTGDHIGHPSCEGGKATGTHIHITRQYNGEWILADGVLAFNFEGWVAHKGDAPYEGTLTRYMQTVVANTNASYKTFVTRSLK